MGCFEHASIPSGQTNPFSQVVSVAELKESQPRLPQRMIPGNLSHMYLWSYLGLGGIQPSYSSAVGQTPSSVIFPSIMPSHQEPIISDSPYKHSGPYTHSKSFHEFFTQSSCAQVKIVMLWNQSVYVICVPTIPETRQAMSTITLKSSITHQHER